MKRLIALLLALLIVTGVSSGIAEGWECPNCGKDGITSQFCPDCGTKKPSTPTIVLSTDYNVGDNVYFGTYEQDNNDNNGTEKIRWIVIAVDGDKLFLLSKKGLDRHRFNDRSNGEVWSGSELRNWLNSSFLSDAFTYKEAEAIQTTSVVDDKTQTNPKWNNSNRFSGTTKDKIFLLSYQEMLDLVSKQDRLCEPTIYLRHKKEVFVEQHGGHPCCWYWLRTSAYRNNAGVVDVDGDFETCYISHEYGVVRPALWVEASAVTK